MIIFRLPFENTIYSTKENTDGDFISFFSFDNSQEIKIQGEIFPLSEEELKEISFSLPSKKESTLNESFDDYVEKIKSTVEFIKENDLPKLVIARKKQVQYKNIHIVESFQNLIKSYPSAFVYAFVQDGICWMGAFSELLGKYTPATKVFETMSLAGTLPINEHWTEKEIEEQKPVTNYIEERMKRFVTDLHISETYDHPSGNIKHLRNDFKGNLEESQVENLIQELHPTPAVCGIPKDFCKSAIARFEKFDRELYAGYSKIQLKDTTYYFVNLRCGKFYANQAELFVGGGITALSNPEREWQETELKSEALLKNMVIS